MSIHTTAIINNNNTCFSDQSPFFLTAITNYLRNIDITAIVLDPAKYLPGGKNEYADCHYHHLQQHH